jgi:hypothetical protein
MVFVFLQDDDNRTISICESVASTVTAPSDGEQMLSDNEDNRDTDDSGTASAPSPRPLHLDDRGNPKVYTFWNVYLVTIILILLKRRKKAITG